MEIKNFWKLLSRRKGILIIVPLITVVVAYFLVKNLPDSYKSRARIASGIVDKSDAIISNETNVQESQINQEFGNIIQMITLKKIVNQVSYQLMIHDLTNQKPYRKLSSDVASLSEAEKKRAVEVYTQKYNSMEDLSPWNEEQNKLYKLLESMKYDHESIQKKLTVYRVGNSDFIDLLFESENPQLSAYLLNTLCKEFSSYYTTFTTLNKRKSVAFLDSLLRQKQSTLDAKMQALKNYKIRNNVVDVNEQATSLISQIAEFEAKKQEAQKNISAYSGALKNIESKFNPNDRKYLESSVTKNNQDILATRNRLSLANENYIKNNFDPKYKAKVDSLQDVLTSQINQSNDNYSYNPLSSKQDLVSQKLNLEVSLELAKNSVASLNSEVGRLSQKLNVLAPNQANIQAYENGIDVDSKEYLELTKKYNQASMEASLPVKLRQVEMAMPGTSEPSKKLLLIGFSGLASFILCFLVLFVMFYFDNSINDVQQLANATQQPVIGSLNLLSGDDLDLNEVWNGTTETAELKHFKSLLRSIRFEIANGLDTSKIIAITSLQPNEGKSFLALNLAYAYFKGNQKVLLIDGNFENPRITEQSSIEYNVEDVLTSDDEFLSVYSLKKDFVVLGNQGRDISIFELNQNNLIKTKLEGLKEQFDIIIIETPSISSLNKAKEWFTFVDKIIPVYEAGTAFNDEKKQEAQYLISQPNKVLGWVLNKVKVTIKNSSTKRITKKKAQKAVTV